MILSSAVQRQKAVPAYFTSKQIMPLQSRVAANRMACSRYINLITVIPFSSLVKYRF